MVIIDVNIGWVNKNYCASVDDKVPGAIVVTDKDFDGIKKAVKEAVLFHIEGMKSDGDYIPEWLLNGDYKFNWVLETSALLRSCEKYTSIAAISRATGINKYLLSHYASGIKIPSKKQRDRIVDGIHKIGEEFLSVV